MLRYFISRPENIFYEDVTIVSFFLHSHPVPVLNQLSLALKAHIIPRTIEVIRIEVIGVRNYKLTLAELNRLEDRLSEPRNHMSLKGMCLREGSIVVLPNVNHFMHKSRGFQN